MSPPTSMLCSMKGFREAGLDWVENTPEELEATTKEMLERTNGGLPSTITDDDLRKCFKRLAVDCGKKYHGRPVKAFAPIRREFIAQHAGFLS